MKYLWILLICHLSATEHADVAKISEAMGHIIGKNLEILGLDFDLHAVVKGLQDESEGKLSPMDEEECIQAIASLQEEKMAVQAIEEYKLTDTISNGDQVLEHEDHPLPTSDSSEYR